MRKLVTDVKVIPGEEVALQHQLLVCDMMIDVPPKSRREFTPRLKVRKLNDPQASNNFQEVFNSHVSTSAGIADGATEDIWNNIPANRKRYHNVSIWLYVGLVATQHRFNLTMTFSMSCRKVMLKPTIGKRC